MNDPMQQRALNMLRPITDEAARVHLSEGERQAFRDKAALGALQALIENPFALERLGALHYRGEMLDRVAQGQHNREVLAAVAWQVAEAMVEAREKQR
jgi:hypothetical protein